MALDREFTLIYDRKINGFPAFSDRVPGFGTSLNNRVFTSKNGNLWEEHIETEDRNNFFGIPYSSSVTVVFNDQSDTIKNFKTLGYEGNAGSWRAEISSDQESEILYTVSRRFIVNERGTTRFQLDHEASRDGITSVTVSTVLGEVLQEVNSEDVLVPLPFTIDRDILTYVGTTPLEPSLRVDVLYTTTEVIPGGLMIPPPRTVNGEVEIPDFIEREGKHFAYIRGIERNEIDLDLSSYTTGGIGIGNVLATNSLDEGIMGAAEAQIDDTTQAVDTTVNRGIDGEATFSRISEVTTVGSSLVTTRSARIAGTVVTDYALDLTFRGFFFATTEAALTDPASRRVFTMLGIGDFALDLTGLDGNQQYFFQAFATNASGTGMGDVENFTTPARVLPVVATRVVFNADETAGDIIAAVTDTDQAPGVAFVYEWLRNGIVIPNATSDRIAFTESGTYTVNVTDQDGGVGTSQELVNVNMLPTATVNADALVVTGAASTFQLSVSDTEVIDTITLTVGTDTTNLLSAANITTLTDTGLLTLDIIPPAGVNVYTLTVTDTRGGVTTDTTTVTAGVVPIVTFATAFSPAGEHTATVTPTITDTDQPAGTDHTTGWFLADTTATPVTYTTITSTDTTDDVHLVGTAPLQRLVASVDGTYEFRATDANNITGRECTVLDVNDTAPMVGITAPPDYDPGDVIQVGLTASDDHDVITAASLTINGGPNLIDAAGVTALETTGTYIHEITAPTGGDQALVFTVTDARGAVGTAMHTVAINMTTNTLNISAANANSTVNVSNRVLTGQPGNAFPTFNVTVAAAAGRRITGQSTCTLTPAVAGINCAATSNTNVRISGTYPTTENTVAVRITTPTQVDPPNINVTRNGNSFSYTTQDGSSTTGTLVFASNCPNSNPGTSTRNIPGSASFSLGNIGCPTGCGGSLTVSASGYDTGSASYTVNPAGSCTCRNASISYSGPGTVAGNSTYGCGGNGGSGQTNNVSCTCAQSGQDLTGTGTGQWRLRIRPAPNSNQPTCSGGGGVTVTNRFGVTAGNGDPEWLVDYTVTNGGSGSISCTAN